jgi:hypothetical protein
VITSSGRTGAGDPLLLLGVTAENIARLTAGQPIAIPADRLADLDLPPMLVVIHYGSDEAEIVAALEAYGFARAPDAGG